jgi:rare lipoprotein A
MNSLACGKPFVTVLVVIALAASCAERKVPMAPQTAPQVAPAPATPALVTPPALSSATAVAGPVYRETGVASWYGKDFQGRKTASGEVFDMYGMSAAHRTLPLGTVIRVTNLENYKSLTVRVNDRGPFVKNRFLELSYGAAKELGFVAQGTATVKIETLEPVNGNSPYTVQAAVFAEEESAKMLKDRLSKKFEQIFIAPFESNLGKLYRVRVGSYSTEEKAELVAGKLKLEGLEPVVFRKD